MTDYNKKKGHIRGRTNNGEPNAVDVYIGNRMRLRRTMLQMSQQHLAFKLGLTFQQVQKYEKGFNRIGASRLLDIALALGVDLNFFVEDMNDEVKFSSPMLHSLSDEERAEILEDDHLDEAKDPLKKSESLRLTCAYFKINNRKLAEKLLEILEIMSRSNSSMA